ncbi:MAG: glycosyltransferase family 4 protein, partial [Elusimicrobia bacterium]|nr:glycosyltransferase family 4 protein [Elusimicrobiota bacterium]
ASLARPDGEFDLVQVNGFITWAPAHVNVSHFVHSSWLKHLRGSSGAGSAPYRLYQFVYAWLNSRLERRAYLQAAVVVAVSEKVREELLAIGVPADRVQVIHNGVDLEEFSPRDGDLGARRRRAGLPEGVPLGLFVGDIKTSRKNLDLVLDALPRVPRLHVAVAGATEGSPYPDLAESRGLSGRVHFLGFRDDVPEIMRLSDLFIFPSRYEACALALIEAMASGLPVVAVSGVGGAVSVDAGSGVLLSSPDDAEELARALNALLDDPARLRGMRAAARANAERYGLPGVVAAYADLYQGMARA